MSTRRSHDPPYPYTNNMKAVAPAQHNPSQPQQHLPLLPQHPNPLAPRPPFRDLPPLHDFSASPSREISPEKSPGYSFQSSSRLDDLGSVFGYLTQPGQSSTGTNVENSFVPPQPAPTTTIPPPPPPVSAPSLFWNPVPPPPYAPTRTSPIRFGIDATYEHGFALSPSAGATVAAVDEDYYVRAAARAADNAKLAHRMWLKEAQREREATAQRSGLPLSAKDKERERSRRESAVTRKRAEVYISELEQAARRLPQLERRLAALSAALQAAAAAPPPPAFTSPTSNGSPPSSTDDPRTQAGMTTHS